jgi:prolyl oligopeptidase
MEKARPRSQPPFKISQSKEVAVIRHTWFPTSAFVVVLTALSAWGDNLPAPPVTPKQPVVDTYHDTRVSDDYRWLEKGTDPAVRRWSEAQNRRTRAYLDSLPGLPTLRAQVKKLLSASSADWNSLQPGGGKFFALKTQPPKEQALLVMFSCIDDLTTEQVILDPVQLDPKAKTSIDFFVSSPNGRLVAVSLSEGGSEEGTVYVFESATGKKLPDVIPRVQFPTGGGSLAWNAEGSGFYYTRYPGGDERPAADRNFFQQVYFHKLGTATAEDSYALGKEFPRIAETVLTTSADGRYVLATVQNGDGGEFAHFVREPAGTWVQITRFEDQITGAVFGPGESLYLVSQNKAPRGKILRLPLATLSLAQAQTVVPESDAAIQGVRFTSNTFAPGIVATAQRLYVVDVVGGPAQIRVFDADGKAHGKVPLPPIASVEQVVPFHGDAILVRSQTYLSPPAWYYFDPASGEIRRTAFARNSPADFGDSEVVREFAVSQDGTRVPLNILRRKGTKLDGRNPTLLTGYGGFGISLTPGFGVTNRVWLDRGGVIAVANLRGGREYGETWHLGGNLTHKQNVFDDFVACARHLVERKYTCPDKLAIEGGSNGGLLMGAVLTQHPDLCRAVVSHVGLYDMLRFEQSPNGVFIATEYGSVKDPMQFRALFAYSPYHHVRDGADYPAVLMLTGENDGRADPAHSRKMTARLQAASSARPILLRTNFGAGHGRGTGLSDRIAETADVFAFLFYELGVDPKAAF